MNLGRIVGEPTAGWVIYTRNVELTDGSVLRLPETGVTDSNGKNMERNPRPVDVLVTRAIGESYLDRDSQLDAAVAELLKTLPAPNSPAPSVRSSSSGGE